MAKKWADPLDRLLEADEKARSVTDYLKMPPTQTGQKKAGDKVNIPVSQEIYPSLEIVEIDVNAIKRWKHKDRPENELGDIKDLAETFKAIGQQQPCILRPLKNDIKKYELIVGERRWRAAEIAGIALKAIIKDLDDKTAALIQAVENEKRSDISEFAKGMSFADKIENELISAKDIVEILGINKQQVTRLLSYKKIPKPLFEAIGDFRKVSSRTAYELVRLSTKSEQHLLILIKLADKIRDGLYGQKRIERELENELSHHTNILKENKKVMSDNGRHLFTWRLDSNAVPSIHFPKDILNLLQKNTLDFDGLTQNLKEYIDQKLNSRGAKEVVQPTLDESPRGDYKSFEKA